MERLPKSRRKNIKITFWDWRFGYYSESYHWEKTIQRLNGKKGQGNRQKDIIRGRKEAVIKYSS